jgi:hypothetical protein
LRRGADVFPADAEVIRTLATAAALLTGVPPQRAILSAGDESVADGVVPVHAGWSLVLRDGAGLL